MLAHTTMNVFLTGKSGVGKTTLIHTFLQTYSGTIGGFRTTRTETDDDADPFIALTNVQDPSLTRKAALCIDGKAVLIDHSAFEEIGAEALVFDDIPSLVLMDELGVLEKDCVRFQAGVHACLDADVHVLGVLKKKNGVFLQSVRERGDVVQIDLDHTPPDVALEKLKKLLG